MKPPGHESETVDWQSAHARLEQALRTSSEPSSEEASLILRRRAQALVGPPPAVEEAGNPVDLVVFTRSDERYAFEAGMVEAVTALHDLTAVPGAPVGVAGVTNHRGRVVPVIDVARLLGSYGQPIMPRRLMVAVRNAHGIFGVLADELVGLVRTDAILWSSLPPTTSAHLQSVVRGVTPDMVKVLDAGILLTIESRQGGRTQ